jgi:GTP-binding protein
MKPVVAIVGRVNVGKSTLFNRLIGKQISIVQDLPGTTRDRIVADTSLLGHEITLIDTGGLEPGINIPMNKKIKQQVDIAISESDVIIFLTDCQAGITAAEREIADTLRKSNKPIILVVNKADNSALEIQANEFHQLGLGSPVVISAIHGRGVNDLIDKLLELIPEYIPSDTITNAEMLKLAIVGRPNVGKSMLLNAIVKEERVIVDSVPGTTREAVDTLFNFEGKDFLLIDTAGIKRRGRTSAGVEFYSLMRSLRAINRCDIALLVIDAAEFITTQDVHIAGYIKDAYKGMSIIVNKWDLIHEVRQEDYASQVRQKVKFIDHVPILFVSAKLGQGTDKIIPTAIDIWHERNKQLPDTVIDKVIKQASQNQPPSRKGLQRLEIFRAYQEGVNPPSFFFLVNDPNLVHFSYQRYLENKLRQTFGFHGTSLRFRFMKAPRRKRGKISEREK